MVADPANASLPSALLNLTDSDRIIQVNVLNPVNLKEFSTDKGAFPKLHS